MTSDNSDKETLLRLVAKENEARLDELRGDPTTSQAHWRAVAREWRSYAAEEAEQDRKALGYLSAALAGLECGDTEFVKDCVRRGLRCSYVPVFVGVELRDVLKRIP